MLKRSPGYTKRLLYDANARPGHLSLDTSGRETMCSLHTVKTMDWTPVWALPNIDLDKPIEAGWAAFVPNTDPRVSAIKRAHPEFRKFIGKFTDTFGHRIRPPLIIRREDTPRTFRDIEALASFRDVIVASIVPRSRALRIIHDRSTRGVPFSDYFFLHPWMTDPWYKHLIAYTPATLALDLTDKFRGQSSPDVNRAVVNRGDFDEPLLQILLRRWIERYETNKPSWENKALFRSLNMAYNASSMPSSSTLTIYDFGRIIGLWVSSFEILVHPGLSGRVNLGKVFDLLESVPWLNAKCANRYYLTDKNGRYEGRRNIACRIYDQIYIQRNKFFHGNDVQKSNLLMKSSGRSVFGYAAILYRLGLTAFLDLKYHVDIPAREDVTAFAEYISDRMDFREPQELAEQALMLARVTPEAARESRQRVIDAKMRQSRELKAAAALRPVLPSRS